MPRNDFQSRLARVMDRGNLRTADVARWFGRRHSTVRGWVVDGRAPAGTMADVEALLERLSQLEGLAQIKTLRGTGLRCHIAAGASASA